MFGSKFSAFTYTTTLLLLTTSEHSEHSEACIAQTNHVGDVIIYMNLK